MLAGAKKFVLGVWIILALSFLVTTAVLMYEFGSFANPANLGGSQWFSLAVLYSHLFVFFPTFGIMALAAFFIPASVFVDMYWHHVPYGRARFIAGFLVVAALSVAGAWLIDQSKVRSIWELKPGVLAADQGLPAGCANRAGLCQRLPILQSVKTLRKVSADHVGLARFVRNCNPDIFIPLPEARTEKRFCFAVSQLPDNDENVSRADREKQHVTASQCCNAQRLTVTWLRDQRNVDDQRSLTGKVHVLLLPLKVFFLLVLLLVGAFLALRHVNIYTNYREIAPRLERGVLLGALVMLPWPMMNHAFFDSSAMLFGSAKGSIFRDMLPVLSVAYGAWGLLLLFYFYRRYEAETEMVAKVTGLIASGVAILKYELIIDYIVNFFGSGASAVSIGALLFSSPAFLSSCSCRPGAKQFHRRTWARARRAPLQADG